MGVELGRGGDLVRWENAGVQVRKEAGLTESNQIIAAPLSPQHALAHIARTHNTRSFSQGLGIYRCRVTYDGRAFNDLKATPFPGWAGSLAEWQYALDQYGCDWHVDIALGEPGLDAEPGEPGLDAQPGEPGVAAARAQEKLDKRVAAEYHRCGLLPSLPTATHL